MSKPIRLKGVHHALSERSGLIKWISRTVSGLGETLQCSMLPFPFVPLN
jgi:hypothetical protein